MQHNQRKHSKIGASKSEQWINCPKSVKLSELAPKPPSNEAAERGTACHEALEYCLSLGHEAKDVIGEDFNGFEFTQEMAYGVQLAIDHVKETYHHYKRKGYKPQLLIEKKFRLESIHPELYGTSDIIIIIPFLKIIVMDYKNGVGLVEVENNSQLMIYGLGASADDDYAEIELHIIQPNADHEDGPIRIQVMTHQKLLDWVPDLIKAIERTEDDDAPLKTGSWCKFCAAAAICPAKKEQAMALAKTDFDNVPNLPDIEELSDTQIVKILEQSPEITNWFKRVKDYALLKLVNGEKIKGLKLVRGKGSRNWLNQEFVKRKFGSKIIKPAEMMSVSQAEKVLGKSILEGHWKKYEGNINIVPDSDKRKPIADAKDDFTAIEWEVENED